MVSKNFGLSGSIENTIALNRLMNELQTKYNRHDLKSMTNIRNENSKGMMVKAAIDVKMISPFMQIIQKATARGANFRVWNSLT